MPSFTTWRPHYLHHAIIINMVISLWHNYACRDLGVAIMTLLSYLWCHYEHHAIIINMVTSLSASCHQYQHRDILRSWPHYCNHDIIIILMMILSSSWRYYQHHAIIIGTCLTSMNFKHGWLDRQMERRTFSSWGMKFMF